MVGGYCRLYLCRHNTRLGSVNGNAVVIVREPGYESQILQTENPKSKSSC